MRYPTSEAEVESGDRFPVLITNSVQIQNANKQTRERGDTDVSSPIINVCCNCDNAEQVKLAIKPYNYLFKAPVKGRWLHHPLLNVFVKEFAFVPSCHKSVEYELTQKQQKNNKEEKLKCDEESIIYKRLEGSLDPRITLPGYVKELCDGILYLHGRESECRSAGYAYKNALLLLYSQHFNNNSNNNSNNCTRKDVILTNDTVCTESANNEMLNTSNKEEEGIWNKMKRWLQQQSREFVHTLLNSDECMNEYWPQQLLILSQKDVIFHHVERQEGVIPANEPIVLVAFKPPQSLLPHVTPQSNHKTLNGELSFLAVSKPAGVPVHPSGAFRKNSITSILEDVFGGVDKDRYELKEVRDICTSNLCYVSVIHRKYKFELKRILFANSDKKHLEKQKYEEREMFSDGLSEENYLYLKEMMLPSDINVTNVNNNNINSNIENGSNDKNVHDAILLNVIYNDTASNKIEENSCKCSNRNRSITSKTNKENVERQDTSRALKLFVVHRLDCATSGVLIFGLNKQSARQLATAMANKHDCATYNLTASETKEEKHVEQEESNSRIKMNTESQLECAKEYIALVYGKFDVEELAAHQHHCERTVDENSSLIVRRSIGCLSPQMSLYWCPSYTEEENVLISHNNNTNKSSQNCLELPKEENVNEEEEEYCEKEDLCKEVVYCKKTKEENDFSSNTCSIKKSKRRKIDLEKKHALMEARTLGKSHYYTEVDDDDDNDITHLSSMRKEELCNDTRAKPPRNFFAPSLSLLCREFKSTLRSATSVLQLIEYNSHRNVSLVKCTLVTGRTHQLRVHLASLNHPIVNDVKYIQLTDEFRRLHTSSNSDTVTVNESNSNVNFDDVMLYYQSQIKFHSSNITPATNADSLLELEEHNHVDTCQEKCHSRLHPEQICLHAWKYTITQSTSCSFDNEHNVCNEKSVKNENNRRVVMHINVPLPS